MLGVAAKAVIERARGQVAEAIGCAPSDVVFMSGGTEANNVVIRSSISGRARPHVVATAIEHDSVLVPLRQLEAAGALRLSVVRPDASGAVAVSSILEALVQISYASCSSLFMKGRPLRRRS